VEPPRPRAHRSGERDSGWDKLVFATPETTRASNIHVREAGSANERYALLFRDYLRSDESARDAWAAFKVGLAKRVVSLETYGQIKDHATDVLMLAAENWAKDSEWKPRRP